MTTIDGPFHPEDLVASSVEALKVVGDARSIAVLASGQFRLEMWNSDFGVDYWRLCIEIPVQLFYALTEEDRNDIAKRLYDIIYPFYAPFSSDRLDSVVIVPLVSNAPAGWREEAIRFAKGEGVTNQGRVRSDNIASMQHQGLLFRSKAEITLFNAMTRAQLAVAPLPVFVRIGKVYNRLEPDFLVIYKGLTFVVEVDGDTFHKELPAEADKRLVPLTYEGVEVRRIRATDLSNDVEADKVVRDLIEFMARRKESR